jgi:high-affinity Fe2+/Pb2+ permease
MKKKRPVHMTSGEHLIMTGCVILIVILMVFAGGCTHIDHNKSPTWEYPK